MKFSIMLRDARRAKGLTLAELGAAIGKSVQYLSDIERNRRNPPPAATLLAICRALGAEPTPLFKAGQKCLVSALYADSRTTDNQRAAVRVILGLKW